MLIMHINVYVIHQLKYKNSALVVHRRGWRDDLGHVKIQALLSPALFSRFILGTGELDMQLT